MNLDWRKSFHLDRSRQIAGVLLSHGRDFLKNNKQHIAAGSFPFTSPQSTRLKRLARERYKQTFHSAHSGNVWVQGFDRQRPHGGARDLRPQEH